MHKGSFTSNDSTEIHNNHDNHNNINTLHLLTAYCDSKRSVVSFNIIIHWDRLYLLLAFYRWNSEFNNSKAHTSFGSRIKFLTKFHLPLKSYSQLLCIPQGKCIVRRKKTASSRQHLENTCKTVIFNTCLLRFLER